MFKIQVNNIKLLPVYTKNIQNGSHGIQFSISPEQTKKSILPQASDLSQKTRGESRPGWNTFNKRRERVYPFPPLSNCHLLFMTRRIRITIVSGSRWNLFVIYSLITIYHSLVWERTWFANLSILFVFMNVNVINYFIG